jgi:TolB-like protein/tetratricopeptide (TPR) repeat protein
MPERSLLQRLIHRKLVPWSLAYLAGAFVAFQGLEIAMQSVSIPALLTRSIQIVLILGFLLTVLLAWHHGAPGPQRVTGRELMLLAAVLAAGGTAMFFLQRVEGDVTLPEGFTISTGEEASVGGGGRSPAEDRARLGDLIAATIPGEGDQFEASIAILPLENRAGAAALDTLSQGVTDQLIGRLSRIRGLKVISRQSVQELEGLELTHAQVADTLGVDHLLVGVSLPTSEGAAVEISLLQVPEDVEIWTNSYTLGPATREEVVEEIFSEVATALLVEVSTLSLRSGSRNTDSPGYVAYLAGTTLLSTRTRDGVVRAIDAFKAAIRLDSNFARAYAGLSSAYALSVTYRYEIGVDAYAAAGLALKASGIAVELDDEMAEAFAARGYISTLALAPVQTVGADFRRAMELQPNAPNVPAWYANLLIREGAYDRALAEAQRAVDLDPLSSPRRTGLAYESLRARDFGQAIEQARVAQSLEAEVMLPRSIQARALLLSGRAEECLEMDLGPHAGIRAMCLHTVGRRDEAQLIVDSLSNTARSGQNVGEDFTLVIPTGDLAAYFAWTGDHERAMPWIHRVYALSPSGIDPRVLESGLFDELQENRVYRREIEDIRSRIWFRVQREEAEAVIGVGGRDR